MYSNPNKKWCRIMHKNFLDIRDPKCVLTILDPPKGSTVWNFMLQSRDLVQHYISWEVHKGDDINFWDDSWQCLPPLDHQNNVDLVNIFSAWWGVKIIDYVLSVDRFTSYEVIKFSRKFII